MKTNDLDLATLPALTDEVLAGRIAAHLAGMEGRKVTFAQLVAAGEGLPDAARKAGYAASTANKRARGIARGRDVSLAITLLREQGARRANVSLGDVLMGLRRVHKRAMETDDLPTACRTLVEMARLSGLDPAERLRLEVSRAPEALSRFTEDDWELASRLMHQAKALPPAAQVVDVSPEPGRVPEEVADEP